MADDCYACTVAAKHPATTLRGPAGCLSCESRALAVVYGGMTRDQIDPVLHMAWVDTKTFTKGRALFWSWVKRIEEAKEKTQ